MLCVSNGQKSALEEHPAELCLKPRAQQPLVSLLHLELFLETVSFPSGTLLLTPCWALACVGPEGGSARDGTLLLLRMPSGAGRL